MATRVSRREPLAQPQILTALGARDGLDDAIDRCNACAKTGRRVPMTAEELQEIGCQIVIFPSTQTWLLAHVNAHLANEVRARATTQGLADRFMAFDDINAPLGQAHWEREV
jgi:2-methylisocitrate lyase-like PEP mutase family enzyme